MRHQRNHSLLEKCRELTLILAFGQAPGWVKGELAECRLGTVGQDEGGLVMSECTLASFTDSRSDSHSLSSRIYASLANFFSALAGSLFAGYLNLNRGTFHFLNELFTA